MKKDLSWNVSATVFPKCAILLAFWLAIFTSKAMAQTTWNGSVSTDWFAGSNWSSGIPTAATDVTIPSGTANPPVINGTGAVCNNLTVNSGASLTISGTNALTISGNFSNSGSFNAGSGTVTYNGAAQTIAPVTYYNLELAGSGVKTITGVNSVGGNFIMDGDNTTYAQSSSGSSPVFSIGGDMTINAGNTFVATNGSPTLSVTGNTSISGTVTSPGGGKIFNGDFTINAGGSWTESASPTWTIYGSVTNNGTLTWPTASIRLAGSGKTINGTLAVVTLAMVSGSSYTNTGNLTAQTINNPGTLIQDEGAVLTVTNNIAAGVSLDATATDNTVNYTGTNQTIRTSGYYNLNLGGSGTKSFTLASYTVNGDLTVGSGVTMDATSAAGIAIDLKGDFTNNGTFAPGTSTVSFTGSAAQTIGGSSTASMYNMTIGTGAVVDASSGLALDLKGDFTNNGTFTPNTSTVSFTGSAEQTIGGSSATTSMHNLTIGTGASLTISGTNELAISGSFSNSGTFDAGNSTVTYNGAAQTVTPVLYHNLKLAGSGIKTITGVNSVGGNFIMDGDNTTSTTTVVGNPIYPVFSIGGDMIINAGNTFAATNGSPTLIVQGNTSISGKVTSPGGGKFFYGDFTINAGGSWTEPDPAVSPAYNMSGNVTNNGTFNLVSPTISMRLAGSGKTINGTIAVGTLWMLSGSSYTNTGNLTVGSITDPGTLTQDEGAVLTVTNTITSNVNLDASATDNTVNYTGTDQTIKTAEYYYLNLGGSGTKSFTSASYTVDGDLTVGSGVTMNAASGIALDLKGDFTNNGTFTPNTSTVSFTGSAAQTIGGSSATSVYNLTMNNSGGLLLSKGLSVGGTLTFTDGVITSTASSLLTFSDGSAASGGGTGKYVDGPVRKAGNTAFTFPIGKSGVYAPLSISAPANATDAFTAEYMRSAASALGSISASGLKLVSGCEYWNLDRSSGTSNVNVTLSWSGSSPCGAAPYIEDPLSIVVAHFDGSGWNSFGSDGGITGDATSGTVTWNNVSEFSPFTLGTTTFDNPLPLKFGPIRASLKNNGVQVDWVILMEEDVDHYEVERSSNGQSFVTIGQREAIANNSRQASYTWLDALPPAGDLYYRIKSVDIDGKLNYGPIVRISPDASAGSDFILYPNPTVNKTVSFQLRNLVKGQYQLMVTDMKGSVIYSETLSHAGGAISQSLQLPASVVTGVYILSIKGNSGGFTSTFVVR
jgi:hypothetical protein